MFFWQGINSKLNQIKSKTNPRKITSFSDLKKKKKKLQDGITILQNKGAMLKPNGTKKNNERINEVQEKHKQSS